MPNRTIYLPEELDEISRRLGLNLSRLTQRAIEAEIAARSDEALATRIQAASARAEALGIDWPPGLLADERREAGER